MNLKHAIAQEFSNIDLRVRYLTGSNLGVTRKQIKVELSFISDKPVSFTVKLNFFDSNGRTFPIVVSGTADTHTYTLIDPFPTLEQEKSNEQWVSHLEKSCQFVKHYLNSTGQLQD